MSDPSWIEIILYSSSSQEAWRNVFSKLLTVSLQNASPIKLHEATVVPDRLLAEAAWELWTTYSDGAPRTSRALRDWCATQSATGRAVLILDALSLRELHVLVAGAEVHGASPTTVSLTGSDVPSDTNAFARALGLSSRSQLANDHAPADFPLCAGSVYTDIFGLPFDDCISRVPNAKNVVIWHTWLDDLIHVHNKLPDQISKAASETLQGDGFWRFVNRMRQGRRLIVTSDHGYAVSKLFSSEETDEDVVEEMRRTFGASRCKPSLQSWQRRFMPPLVMTENAHHVVMGQRKWKVQGGFPHVCHGGLSLLEVVVPFVEFPAL